MPRLAGRVHDGVQRHERWVLAVIALVVLASGGLATRLKVDASFRPFFATGDRQAEVTKQFEGVFGQPSGAYLVAIYQHDDVLAPEVLRSIGEVGQRVAGIPHITQVLSLANDPRVAPVLAGGGTSPLPTGLVDQLRSDPQIVGNLLAKDGRSTALVARVDLPLADLAGRRPVIDAFNSAVGTGAPAGSTVRTTGVSVVEAEFADLVIREMLISIGVLSTVLLIVLYLHFRRVGAVLVVMTPVWLAIPVTLAIMATAGIAVTAVSSQVLTIVLIVGVAQGIRLQEQLYRGREAGLDLPVASRTGFVRLAVPGLATAVTTAVGFFSLLGAHIAIIREFAIASGFGVVAVFLLASILIPVLQRRLQPDRHAGLGSRARLTRGVLGAVETTTVRWPALVLAVGVVGLGVLAVVGVPRLDLNQRFNGELPASDHITANQRLLEQQYSGFLGPEVWVRPSGGHVTDPAQLAAIRTFADGVRRLPETLRVTAVTDYLPPGVSGPEADRILDGLRADPRLAPLIHEVVTGDAGQGDVIVRTTDMGSERAGPFVDDVNHLASQSFGDTARVDVVGQWWMAQRGMRGLLSDMLQSVLTAAVIILVILGVTLRSVRFFVLALLPSVAPILGAIGVMGVLGISLRIGTATILAVALGLVVDDTIYYLIRLKAGHEQGSSPREAVRQMFAHDARAGLLSSLVLIAGFATMTVNHLSAIHDMGIVAVLTMSIAVAADLFFDPAQFLLTSRRQAEPSAELLPASERGPMQESPT
jgi:uncharacterized protein